jgi:hypothetical protein
VIWRLFRRTARSDPWADWWDAADRAASAPSTAAIDRLRQALASARPGDDVEPQEEMVEGLRRLLALAAGNGLPVLESQHRVIGSDACHFMAPVTLATADAAPGKLFFTSRRMVLVSAGVASKPWHAVRHVARAGRRLAIGAGEEAIAVNCNSFGDALAAHHIATRLASGARQS